MPELEIIGAPVSNYVRACRMVCEEKGVPHTSIPARPHAPEVAAIHPYGLIPVMRHGAVELFESKAICTYIDRVFPGRKVIPEDPVGQALVEQWVAFQNHRIDRTMMREYVVPIVFADKEKGPDRARIEAALPDLARQVALLDKAVAATGFLVGRDFTLADINLLPMLVYTRMQPEGAELIGKARALAAYVDRHQERPSFEATAPPARR